MSIGCVSHFFQGVSFFVFLFLFSTIVFGLVAVMDFDMSLPVGDKFFCSDDTVSWLLGLDRIFK